MAEQKGSFLSRLPIVGRLFESSNEEFYLPPPSVEQIEKPFEQNVPTDTTEFGDNRDLKDVDVTSGTNFLSPFGMFQNTFKSHNDLIKQYRKISELSYVADAVDEITNEAVIWDDEPKDPVYITWNDKNDEVSEEIRKKIQDEFTYILDLLDFDDQGGDFFRQWYVDGRIIFQVILNLRSQKEGIQKVKLMSPLYLTRVFDEKEKRYFWIYDDGKMKDDKGQDVVGKIPDELLVYVPSGYYIKDEEDKHVSISYIHPAIRDINRLDTLEDHLLIYRIVRSPERRVFYIDSGNLPPAKAEEYLRQVIASWKSKKTYDETLGNTSTRNKTPSMLEDIFLLRRNGKGTEVTSLPGGAGIGDLKDLDYFRQRVFNALKVPWTRMNIETSMTQANRLSPSANEITSEEIKFHKFINKLRRRFSVLFFKLLHRQLIYKNIIKPEEWQTYKRKIKFVWLSDAMFTEAKRLKNLSEKIDLLGKVKDFTGVYFSKNQVMTKILGMSPEDILELKREIAQEESDAPIDKEKKDKEGGGSAQ